MRIELFDGNEIKEGIEVAMRGRRSKKWLKWLDYFLAFLYLCFYGAFIVFLWWLIF